MILLSLVLVLVLFISVFIKPLNGLIFYDGNILHSKKNSFESFLVFVVFLALALFAGLRSEYNDTATYLYNFIHYIPESFDKILSIEWSLGQNPGFFLFQVFIKKFISTNENIFILVSSCIVIYLFVYSYYKYSVDFSFTIFLFIASGLYLFSMAAMKQVFAMAIGFWAFRFLIQKKKIKFIIFIVLASTIHPYILFYLIALFLGDDVWSKKISLILLSTLVVGFFFEKFVSFSIQLNSSLGNNYDVEYFENKSGMNIIRVLVYSAVPIMSFLLKSKINNYNNSLLNLCINMSIISFSFMVIGFFGAANMFGRLGNYFEPFTYLSMPFLINHFMTDKVKSPIKFFTIIFYMIYFYYQFAVVKQFEYESWL